ncbi:HI1506-related protein [Dickeya undicola]|uniref:HI1506-related protein n=1 Tax=Dickeya undicola TaxID=1577887 RepID=UPI003F257055
MPIQITARVHGFRRCGMAHSAKASTYPDDHFTAAELATLEAEPQLIVVRVSDEREIASDTATLSAAQSRIEKLEAEQSAAQVRIAELEAAAQERDARLTEAHGTVAALTAERDALQAQLAEAAATADGKAKK